VVHSTVILPPNRHNRRNLGTASLAFYARELGISSMNFLDSLVTGKFGRYVQDDLIAGMKLGVKEAPTFFINGKKYNDSWEENQFLKHLQSFLK